MEDVETLRIAITGGIGSGKSYVCRCLEQHGICVYDCDAAAKRLMRTSRTLRRQLTQLIGEDTYVDGQLNKAAVAGFLMQSEEHTQQVNAIVHPAVGRDFLRSGMTWMECAILFESGFERYVDKVVCVSAPIEVRIRRVMDRDGITREKTLEWMSRQLPQEEVLVRSDYEIINDGICDVGQQVAHLLERLSESSKTIDA